MFSQTWDKISGGIYYPFFFIIIFIYPFHMGYVNPMVRYEIYRSHVSKNYFFINFLFFNILILQNNFFYYKLNL